MIIPGPVIIIMLLVRGTVLAIHKGLSSPTRCHVVHLALIRSKHMLLNSVQITIEVLRVISMMVSVPFEIDLPS
jgi:hypothetical protein